MRLCKELKAVNQHNKVGAPIRQRDSAVAGVQHARRTDGSQENGVFGDPIESTDIGRPYKDIRSSSDYE